MRLSQRQQDAYRDFERRWDAVGFENLSRKERRIVVLEALEGDVMNGGLGQYFFNSSGDLALEALDALKELGALKTHTALSSAIKKVWPNDYPTDREVRYSAINDAESRDEELLDRETRIIQELPEDFLALALEELANEYDKHA